MWCHLSPQNDTFRHMAQKLQMNVFSSISCGSTVYFKNQILTLGILTCSQFVKLIKNSIYIRTEKFMLKMTKIDIDQLFSIILKIEKNNQG